MTRTCPSQVCGLICIGGTPAREMTADLVRHLRMGQILSNKINEVLHRKCIKFCSVPSSKIHILSLRDKQQLYVLMQGMVLFFLCLHFFKNNMLIFIFTGIHTLSLYKKWYLYGHFLSESEKQTRHLLDGNHLQGPFCIKGHCFSNKHHIVEI